MGERLLPIDEEPWRKSEFARPAMVAEPGTEPYEDAAEREARKHKQCNTAASPSRAYLEFRHGRAPGV